MNIHVVDSHQTMLSPNDIFVVAAHEFKDGLDNPKIKKTSRQYKISPERLQYTIMVRMFQDPSLIRIREGNTFFAIKAMPERAGFVFSWNADTARNYVNNMVEFIYAAKKMGFNNLVANLHSEEIVRLTKLADKRLKESGIKFKYDSKSGLLFISIEEKRK